MIVIIFNTYQLSTQQKQCPDESLHMRYLVLEDNVNIALFASVWLLTNKDLIIDTFTSYAR